MVTREALIDRCVREEFPEMFGINSGASLEELGRERRSVLLAEFCDRVRRRFRRYARENTA